VLFVKKLTKISIQLKFVDLSMVLFIRKIVKLKIIVIFYVLFGVKKYI